MPVPFDEVLARYSQEERERIFRRANEFKQLDRLYAKDEDRHHQREADYFCDDVLCTITVNSVGTTVQLISREGDFIRVGDKLIEVKRNTVVKLGDDWEQIEFGS